MKCQALFLSKKEKKKTEFLYATVLFGALNVKHCRVCFSVLFQNYWKNLPLNTILTKYWHTLIAYNQGSGNFEI